jgi:hypothetical protein
MSCAGVPLPRLAIVKAASSQAPVGRDQSLRPAGLPSVVNERGSEVTDGNRRDPHVKEISDGRQGQQAGDPWGYRYSGLNEATDLPDVAAQSDRDFAVWGQSMRYAPVVDGQHDGSHDDP